MIKVMFFVLAVVVVMIQTTVSSHLGIFGVRPDLPLVYLVLFLSMVGDLDFFRLRAPLFDALLAGGFIGITCGIYSAFPIAVCLFSYLLVGIFLWWYQSLSTSNRLWTRFLLPGTATLIGVYGIAAVSAVLEKRWIMVPFRAALISALYNSAIYFLACFALKSIRPAQTVRI